MRNPDRLDDFYERLKRVHKQHVPDWRFGQFICNVFGVIGKDPFFPEDEEMIRLIEECFQETQ